MVPENTNTSEQLLPDRHPQHDLFICDVADAVLKDLIPSMEHPFYSLSKKPERHVRRYEHNGNWIEVRPGVRGLATIYDKDILIYCVSQIMAKLNRGEKVSPRVRINSRELLQFTNRGTGGRDYIALTEALERLGDTRISTNIRTGDEEQFSTFGLIDAASMRRKHGLDGRLLWCEVKLSDWVFNAIRAQEVLTLHRDYFRLRKPLERRIYEVARKHCGEQTQWSVGLKLLLYKSGSQSDLKKFRLMIRNLVDNDHLPDYRVTFDTETDKVTFVNRGGLCDLKEARSWQGHLSSDDIDAARDKAGGWDIYMLERNWRDWMAKNGINPKFPGAHFKSFCVSWVENNGRAN